MDDNVKKIMHVMRRAPHGSIYTYEGLEMILIMAAYEQDLSVAFIGDGVYALKKNQNTDGISMKGFAKNLLWRLTATMWRNSMSTAFHLKNAASLKMIFLWMWSCLTRPKSDAG